MDVKIKIVKMPAGLYYGLGKINGFNFVASGYTHAGVIERLFKFYQAEINK